MSQTLELAAPPLPKSPEPSLPGFSHDYAEVNGTRIHYVQGGDGPAVVLLHGWPYTWALWAKLMPLLAQAGFRVIAPDLRGLGYSADAEEGFEKSNVAEDVRALVNSLGVETIRLVGADIGFMVAYAYASRHPSEVERLVLAECILPGFGLEELMNPATGGYWHFGFHAQADLAAYLTDGKEAGYLTPIYGMMSASASGKDYAAANFLPHYAAPGGMRQGFKHYATLIADGKENRETFSGKLPMPVLVLSGEKGIPQNQTVQSVEKVAGQMEVDKVPAAGHTFALDNPAWTSERLVRFFND